MTKIVIKVSSYHHELVANFGDGVLRPHEGLRRDLTTFKANTDIATTFRRRYRLKVVCCCCLRQDLRIDCKYILLYSSPKKKKRKKEKKTSKTKKRKRHVPSPPIEEEEDQPLPPNIDLSSTLKELRTNSPTKNLIIPDVEINVDTDDSESEENKLKSEGKKKRKREYSEGEWSSDSEEDSGTDGSKRRE